MEQHDKTVCQSIWKTHLVSKKTVERNKLLCEKSMIVTNQE